MANGIKATTTKNAHGNVTNIVCGNHTVENKYNNDHQLTKTVDSVSGTTEFSYNEKGSIEWVKVGDDETESYSYNDKNVLTSKTVGDITYMYTTKSTADKALDSISVDGNTVRPQTDALGRSTGKTVEVGNRKIAEEKISYAKFGDHATSLPSNVRFATNGVFNESIQYRYDSMGNIIEIFENGRSACRYEYDALGRLTREDNVAFGKTATWGYDNNGNILAKYEYAITAKPTNELHLLDCVTKLYTYADNSDQLMSYDGEDFVYDDIGNPETYRGKKAEWEYGRELTSYNGNNFSYDARGRRTAKNGITFTYDSNGNLIKQSNGLEFLYDHSGVFALKYNGSTYFYRKDAQANIVALLDTNGSVVVKYGYDAWGNCKVLNASGLEITDDTHIGILNPFRYRSYYYDTETNLYFLKTRYYDPQIGRFMTIDDISYLDPESINGLNLYAYCLNNPVMMTDDNGCLPNWAKWLIGAVVIIGLGVATAFTGGAAGVILGAAFYGALTGALSGALVSGVIGGITGGWQGFWNGAASGFMSGAIIVGITGALSAGANIATGAVKIVGSAQKTGTFFHKMASNIKAGQMAMQIGRYSQITLDRSLNKGGLIGRKMPDVVGKARWGKDLAVEVVSKSQTASQMKNKLIAIQAYNPNLAKKVIKWAGWIGRWLI